MVIPLRTDSQALGEQSLGHRPILLARLPRVGEPIDSGELGPALAVVPEESIVASPAVEKAPTSYFVDAGHVRESVPAASATEPAESPGPTSSSSSPEKRGSRTRGGHFSRTKMQSSSRTPQATGFASVYCKIHTQLAPFAGAIVALALVSAASLMYWIILSPSPLSLNYGEVANDGFKSSPVEIPAFAPRSSPIPAPESTSVVPSLGAENEKLAKISTEMPARPTVDVYQSVEVAPLEVPPALKSPPQNASPQVAVAVAPKSVPVVEQPAVPIVSEPVVVAEVYPSTSRAAALDFSQVSAAGEGGILTPGTQQVNLSSNLPTQFQAVVQRPGANVTQQPIGQPAVPAVASRPTENIFTSPRR